MLRRVRAPPESFALQLKKVESLISQFEVAAPPFRYMAPPELPWEFDILELYSVNWEQLVQEIAPPATPLLPADDPIYLSNLPNLLSMLKESPSNLTLSRYIEFWPLTAFETVVFSTFTEPTLLR